jgi:predicted PurR-regulated permease PerM
MPTLIASTVVFLLIKQLYSFISPKVKLGWANKLTLIVVIFVVVALVTLAVLGIYYGIKASNSNTQQLADQAFNVLQELKKYLPSGLIGYIPDDILALKEKVVSLAKEQSPHIFDVTANSLKAFVHIILGILLGAVTAFSFLGFKSDENNLKPLTQALFERFSNFGSVFERVIFAQGKISAINSGLTAVYLLVILPLCGIHVPYSKVIILLTFCVGLLPVIGNLISNTFIVLMSLTVSFEAAVTSLGFLVVIHKLEYYINAKIVGSKIKTKIWELLIAMILMETFFGLVGVAIAPIIYGYLKEELKKLDLV